FSRLRPKIWTYARSVTASHPDAVTQSSAPRYDAASERSPAQSQFPWPLAHGRRACDLAQRPPDPRQTVAQLSESAPSIAARHGVVAAWDEVIAITTFECLRGIHTDRGGEAPAEPELCSRCSHGRAGEAPAEPVLFFAPKP